MSSLGEWLNADLLPLVMLALIGVEAVALLLWHRRTGHGPAPMPTLTFLGAGAGFAAALYFHRRGEGAMGLGLALFAALTLHLWHLRVLARLARASHD